MRDFERDSNKVICRAFFADFIGVIVFLGLVVLGECFEGVLFLFVFSKPFVLVVDAGVLDTLCCFSADAHGEWGTLSQLLDLERNEYSSSEPLLRSTW